MNFTKSFFGGYNKAAVDAFVEQRNEKIDSLKEKESTLTDTIAHKNSEIANLSLEIEKMKSEIEKINAENSALKIEANKSHLIFKNVAKIYERAYGAGHDIVLDSKTHSEQMIDNVNKLFFAASNSVNETIAKQNSLKQELTSLYEKIYSLATELTNNTNALFKGAEDYISIFDVFNNIKTNTDEQVETHLKEFEDFGTEFLTAEEIKKNDIVNIIPDSVAISPVIEEEQEISHTADDEQTIAPITQSEEIIEPVIFEVREDINAEPNKTSLSQPQETETATPIEQKTKSQEFTQFGRKSRVSSASREELIRKALLKNGGM